MITENVHEGEWSSMNANAVTDYDKFADIYDVDLGTISRDMEMYKKITTGTDEVLVLSCGTGREINELAKLCNKIVGVDISSEMLKVARKKLINFDNVELFEADMTNFYLEGRMFDLIIIPNNGILHLLNIESIENCMLSMKAHLKETGKILFDFFLPDFLEMGRIKSELYHDFTFYDEVNKQYITRKRIHERNHFKRLNDTTIFYEFTKDDGTCTKRICQYQIRYLFVEEVELLAKIVGLNVSNKYGGFCFENLNEMHSNVVFCLENEVMDND